MSLNQLHSASRIKFGIILKPWPNGLASRRKTKQVCKLNQNLHTDLRRVAKLTDSQVGSQVTKSRKFHAYHWLMRFYNNRLLAINLCRLALGGQTVKNLRLLASKFKSYDSMKMRALTRKNSEGKLDDIGFSAVESAWCPPNFSPVLFSVSVDIFSFYVLLEN